MVTGFSRGHLIFYDFNKKTWRYFDTGTIYDDKRPCAKCGHFPTPEGYDFCLGKIKGAKASCCGHGVNSGYISRE